MNLVLGCFVILIIGACFSLVDSMEVSKTKPVKTPEYEIN